LSEELKLGGAKDYSVGKIRDVNIKLDKMHVRWS
jgi:hypothetical protein